MTGQSIVRKKRIIYFGNDSSVRERYAGGGDCRGYLVSFKVIKIKVSYVGTIFAIEKQFRPRTISNMKSRGGKTVTTV